MEYAVLAHSMTIFRIAHVSNHGEEPESDVILQFLIFNVPHFHLPKCELQSSIILSYTHEIDS